MRRYILAVLGTFLLLGFGMVPALAAQDATPATPAGAPLVAECNAPDIPPGTPTPMEEMGPPEPAEATPPDVLEATPAEVAGPVEAAPEVLNGEPADAETTAEVEAAVNNLAACMNEGQYVEYGALLTPNGLMEECGTTNPYDAEWCYGGTPPIQILSIENVQTIEDDRYSADITYQMGNMLASEQFVFVRHGEWLLLDTSPELAIDVPEGAAVIDGEMVDYEFVLSQESAPAGDIAFNVTNTGEYPHELVVMRFPEGVTVDDLFEDESLFEQVEFFGFTWSEAGEDAPPLVLVDMDPGVYTLVCFIDEPEGIPHVMRGMVVEFEVTAP